MSLQGFLVFVHVLGSMGLFSAVALEAVALGALAKAGTTNEVSAWLELHGTSFRLGGVSMGAILVSGIWMSVTVWGHTPWAAGAFVASVAMGAAGGAVTGRHLRRLRRAVALERGPEPSASLRPLLSARSLPASLRFRLALAIGVVALMTAKPGAAGVLVILAASGAAGIAAGLVRSSPRRPAVRVIDGSPSP